MNYLDDGDIKFDYEDIAIGGKLLSVTFSIPEFKYQQMKDDFEWRKYVRKQLTDLLVEKILDSKYVNISTQLDNVGLNQLVHARVYLAPDEQVKLIRRVAK